MDSNLKIALIVPGAVRLFFSLRMALPLCRCLRENPAVFVRHVTHRFRP